MNRLKYMTYLACAIEQNTDDPTAHTWKDNIKELGNERFGIYDPIEQESKKTGKSFKEACDYLQGIKRGGHYEEFDFLMDEIWWGNVKPKIGNKISLLQYFKNTASIKGNFLEDFGKYGDYEAVCRSDFIIVYLQKNVKTVGTLFEVHTAYLLDIPIYLIISDQTKTEANSTLLRAIRASKGEIFYNVQDCVKKLKEIYKF